MLSVDLIANRQKEEGDIGDVVGLNVGRRFDKEAFSNHKDTICS